MIKTFCDKCGRELTSEEKLLSIELKEKYKYSASIRRIELCKKCRADFLKYIDNHFKQEFDE